LQDEILKILKLVHAVLKENNITIINNIDLKQRVTLSLIIGELSQVIINIINNAKDVFIQRNIDNRKIIFDLKVVENKCIFCIEDNAGGIDESIIDKVFDANFTTKEKTGTGLGLHMSYEIVTEHLNGDLYVKNTNNGAKFILEIPL
jgi:signal transduction histidine kinase